MDCGYFFINNVTINDSIAASGGAIYLETTEQRKEKYATTVEFSAMIVNSKFHNCYSKTKGGAIYLNNLYRVLFDSNYLTSNYAVF